MEAMFQVLGSILKLRHCDRSRIRWHRRERFLVRDSPKTGAIERQIARSHLRIAPVEQQIAKIRHHAHSRLVGTTKPVRPTVSVLIQLKR